MKIKRLGIALSLFAGMAALGVPHFNAASADPKSNTVHDIVFNEEALRLKYGIYGEAEFTLIGPHQGEVYWEVNQSEIPAGLTVLQTTGSELLFYGTPEFTGQWCFVLSARMQQPDERIAKRVCYVSEDNVGLSYPRFAAERHLPLAIRGQEY